ncbi:MAG TPA: MFS transporter, partial [Azospirillaceae bacterium]|nr:MFS transporter [Azospirillaceae bacterium]
MRAAIPKGIWALGLTSLFMDLSSEMIHGLLPVFLVTVIGAGALSVGVIEGIAEATASVTKLFSGSLSDWWGRRKPLTLFGYGIAAVTKPLFPLADSAMTVLTARFVDRIGKGIRGAPRDALVADLTPPEARGAAYGLRQALDTVGAVLGPLVAVAVMLLTGDDFRAVFWLAVLPALLAVAVLAVGVPEPAGLVATRGRGFPLSPAALRRLGPRFWALVAVASVMTLARFSEAFLLLRAEDAGLPVAFVPLMLVVMNVVYTVTSYPVGLLSDRIGRLGLLGGGFAVLIIADVVLALAATPIAVFLGAALWGLHMGMTQGLLAALVADGAPKDQRGTAFGVFNL